jgi:hypothetical protein
MNITADTAGVGRDTQQLSGNGVRGKPAPCKVISGVYTLKLEGIMLIGKPPVPVVQQRTVHVFGLLIIEPPATRISAGVSL